MGIISKIQQEDLEYISLEHFMYILGSSIDGKGFNEFYLLPRLLDKGLRLSYTESGYIFDEQIAFQGDIKCALQRLENKLFDTDEPESKLYKDEIVKTQDGLEISLGNFFVKRSDVEKVYSEYGETTYPWVLVLWPQSSDDWALFPIGVKLSSMSSIESVDGDGAGGQDGTEPASKKVIQSKIGEKDGKRTLSKKDIKIFDKRLNALKEWLISLGYTLENELIKLPKNYTLETVYTDLGKYTEQIEQHKGLFVTIEIDSFDNHFWGKQKIVELMRGNKSAIL